MVFYIFIPLYMWWKQPQPCCITPSIVNCIWWKGNSKWPWGIWPNCLCWAVSNGFGKTKMHFPSSALPHSQLDFLPNGHESCKLQQNGRGRIKSIKVSIWAGQWQTVALLQADSGKGASLVCCFVVLWFRVTACVRYWEICLAIDLRISVRNAL